jgi:uncharacterized protein (TIGR02118 family)
MIKLTYCLRRLPSLTREEFQRYWFETHGPLVRKHTKVLRIKRYVQMHTRDAGINDALQASRGAPEMYDGIAELWWESLADLEAAMSSPEGQVAGAELLADEKKFIDLARSPLWIGEERPVIE